MADVLNPRLYANMMHHFDGRVRVINYRQPMEGFYADDPLGRYGRRLHIVRRGETYVACCPFCGDSRFRLAVNHMYGVPDYGVGRQTNREPSLGHPRTGAAWANWELWKCYNEECQSRDRNTESVSFGEDKRVTKKNYEWLREWLGKGYDGPRIRAAVMPVSRPALEPVEFPGLLIPVGEMPPDHPACLYLSSRRFSPADLSRDWGVAYAASVPARSRGAMSEGRIIVPVFRDRAMVGWQARYAGDVDWKSAGVPKYLTYFPKSLTVYGIDESDRAPVVSLVEGVTDVWRVGFGGVSVLGKTMSPDQAAILADRLRGRPLVLVPDMDDPDSEDSFYRMGREVINAGHRGPVGVAVLPAGKDPADLDEAVLRRIIAEAARRAAVKPHQMTA